MEQACASGRRSVKAMSSGSALLAVGATLVAMMLVGPAVGSAAAAKYSGKTDGGSKISFTTKGKSIKRVSTLVFVTCFENGGNYGIRSGLEFFQPPGSFKSGKEGKVTATRTSAIWGSDLGFNHTFLGKLGKKKATGKLGLTYSYSTYDPFTNSITFWNCFGSNKFSAKPS